jgi:hypothetical protein
MATRYSKSTHIQPIRKIEPAITDIPHPFKEFETIDQLAGKYYGDWTLGWVIMVANPQYFDEFSVPPGVILSIPFPLNRVWAMLGTAGEI